MKKISFFMQIYLILAFVLIVPTTIITSYNVSATITFAEKEIAASALKNMQSVSKTNEMVLFNVIKSTLRLVQNASFKKIRGLNTYAELNSGYENITKAMEIKNVFDELLINESAIHSAFFIMEDGDYVVSSDKGIETLEQYRSQDWLTKETKSNNSVSGFWVARKLHTSTVQEIREGNASDYYVDVVSYVYELRTLASSIKGVIVVNIYEDSINDFLNPSEVDGGMISYLVDESGRIISHQNKIVLGQNISKEPYHQKILAMKEEDHYFYEDIDEERYLYIYHKSDFNHWLYISVNPMEMLMENINSNHSNLILFLAITIFIGTTLMFMVTYRTLKPMRELVAVVKGSDEQHDIEKGNEVLYLANAFQKIQDKGRELSTMLEEKESDTRRLALRELVNGEVIKKETLEILNQVFPYNHFIVIFISIDHQEKYQKLLNSEERMYYRYMLYNLIEAEFTIEGYKVGAIRYSSFISAVIVNIESYDETLIPNQIKQVLTTIQTKTFEMIDYTVTIGVSGLHNGLKGIKACTFEAGEAIRHKIIVGQNTIIFWNKNMNGSTSYHYPHMSEERILNFLHLRDIKSIRHELTIMRHYIISENIISYDNILLIYNQLIGVIIKYLVENNVNSSQIFGDYGNVYAVIATKDTLEEIEVYMGDFIETIILYLSGNKENSELNYYDKILLYINEHYNQDIDFEDMSEVIGISYSYMRKIIKKTTGKSIMECINFKRIEIAKQMLIETDKNILGIANAIGYSNVQSISRFFKKFEGITPSEYRRCNK